MRAISVTELHQKIINKELHGALIVDVRTPEEYRSGHIPGAVNRPLEDMEDCKAEFSLYKEVYLHCRTGGRSGQACEILTHCEVPHVVNVMGGVSAWQAAGFEVEH